MVLDIVHFPHPHTGDNIARKIIETLDEWGLSKKIFCITSNRGPNYVRACKILKGSIVDESFNFDKSKTIGFHHFCGAHVVQSVVKTFLSITNETKKKEPFSELIFKYRYNYYILFYQIIIS